jgi:predicted dithiol-disulfide oxidoreductase (DUF899 family)
MNTIVSEKEWLDARKEFLKKEKELTRLRDSLRAERLRLPWVKVEKEYRFDGPKGEVTLADLFEGRSQLMIQHFMFGPEWEEGCPGCSFLADHADAARVHLEHHDVTLAAVSRAPWPRIEAFKKRMGWKFDWVSSFRSDFNFDYHVSFTQEDREQGRSIYNYEVSKDNEMDELPGHSVFYRDPTDGAIYRTYSMFSRGGEELIGAYNYLEFMPKGRNENGPHHNLMDWVKHHDRYGAPEEKKACCCAEATA